MSFTEGDLKRLKNDFMRCDCTKETQQTYSIGHLRLMALLARLEASEHLAKMAAEEWPGSKAVEEWKKTCGL